MSVVSSWVLSIVGIIILTVIVEITMPDGNINKFIKGILVIFTVFVMVAPIANIDIWEGINVNDFEISLDKDYLEDVNMQIITEYKAVIENKLLEQGYEGVSVDINIKNTENLEIDTIFVYLSNLVLKNKDESINIYNNIKNTIKDVVVVVDSEDIIFYE